MNRLGFSAFGRAAGVICAAMVFVPAATRAEDWIVTIGGKMNASPPYEGADHDVVRPAAVFNVRRADKPYRFGPPDDGSTITFLSHPLHRVWIGGQVSLFTRRPGQADWLR